MAPSIYIEKTIKVAKIMILIFFCKISTLKLTKLSVKNTQSNDEEIVNDKKDVKILF